MNVVRSLIRENIRKYGTARTSSQLNAEKTVEDMFRASVQSGEITLGHADWARVRNNFLSHKKFYNNVNVDATILGFCSKHASLSIGRSYIKFLEEKKIPLTAAIAGKYLKLFSLPKGQECLPDDESAEVLRISKVIRQKYPVLDINTGENLIHALCLTKHWRESLDILDQIREFGQPSHAPFNAISQAAFRNHETDTGIKVLEDGVLANRIPSSASFISWINYGGEIGKLLRFLQRHQLQISEPVATCLKRHLEQSGVVVNMSSISRKKLCGSCGTALDEIELTDGEFRTLQDVFHEKVIIKDNIFIKSTPQEFSEFQRFIKETGPYDCIIDGLNVAYSVGANRPISHLAGHILAAMRYFTQENKRVLILGREHMKRWPGFLKKVETNNGNAFLTENLSQDDPFFIYAALKSGPQCDIFTRDFLRTWAHQLGPELGSVFRRWQRIHQFSYKSPTTSTTPKIFVQPPLKYKIEAHRNSSGMWHVPWTDEGNDFAVNRIPELPFEVPVRWMCFRLLL